MEKLKNLLSKITKAQLVDICDNAYLELPSEVKYGRKQGIIDFMSEKLPVQWQNIFGFFNKEMVDELKAIRDKIMLHKEGTINLTDIVSDIDTALKWEDIFLLFGISFDYGTEKREENGLTTYSTELKLSVEAIEILKSFENYAKPDLFPMLDEIIMLSKGMLVYYGVLSYVELYGIIKKLSRNGSMEFHDFFRFIHYLGQFNPDWPHLEGGIVCHPLLDEPDHIICEQNSRRNISYYELSYEDCRKASKTGFVFVQPQSSNLIKYYLSKGIDRDKAEGLAKNLYYDSMLPMENAARALNLAIQNSLKYITFDGTKNIQNYLNLVQEFLNHTPDWLLKGYTSQQLFKKSNLMPLPQNAFGNKKENKEQRKVIDIGRNMPCPCGSGKKYKHCCGKLQQD